jgi:hypothetical protein
VTRTTIQLREFCALFGIPDREVRYVLESGHVPAGIGKRPGTGKRREFGPGQAFWLAVLMLLKSSGIKSKLAADAADLACEALRSTAQNLSWNWTFQPDLGWFDTDRQYFIEVGDHRYVRVLTDANPSHDGLYAFNWYDIEARRPAPDVAPCVTLRVDLRQIAVVLDRIGGWSRPQHAQGRRVRARRRT